MSGWKRCDLTKFPAGIQLRNPTAMEPLKEHRRRARVFAQTAGEFVISVFAAVLATA